MNLRRDKTILVVDDDLHVVLGLQKRLAEAGLRVEAATNATQACRRARAGGVNAITLDVSLRDQIDGLDAASILSREADTARIPIIFVTGTADSDFQSRCRSAGGRYFLSKPYDSSVMIRTLDGIFGRDELAEMQKVSSVKRRQPTQ